MSDSGQENWFSNKKCAQCGRKFPRLLGDWGIVGVLIIFILFGGASKYCPDCKKAIKASTGKSEKGFLFRLIWFACALLVILMLFSLIL